MKQTADEIEKVKAQCDLNERARRQQEEAQQRLKEEYAKYTADLTGQDPEGVLADADNFIIPTSRRQQFITITSAMKAVVFRPTEERWQQAWKLLERAALQGIPDVGSVCCAPLLRLIEHKKYGGGGHRFSMREEEIQPYIAYLRQTGALVDHSSRPKCYGPCHQGPHNSVEFVQYPDGCTPDAAPDDVICTLATAPNVNDNWEEKYHVSD